ncbi:MAG: reverse transcriptase domain-containing protein [Sedimenticola sp.]
MAARLEPDKAYELVPDGYSGVLEPGDVYRQDSGVLVGRTAGTVQNGLTLVRIVNVSGAPVEIHEDTPLGFFHAAVQQGVKVARVGVYELVDVSKPSVPNQAKCENGDRLHPDVDLSTSILDSLQKSQLQSLLSRYSNVFAKNSSDLGKTTVVQHNINTGDSMPIKQPYRRVPIHLRDEVHKQTQNMLSDGIIEESKSPWSSPVVLAKKKDGSMRFCVDYRRLNSTTHKDAHPLPRIDDCLDALTGASVFTTLDCASGYWQVEVDEADREKTAFSTGSNLYQFRVMPFGLTNAPATFQRLMDLILCGLHWSACLVYLDDIILFSKTVGEHMVLVEEVLRRLQEAGLKLKPSKCQLFQEKVAFLGHVVSKDGTAPDIRNVEKVKNFPTPCSVREVKSFLSLASYYRRFVPEFSCIAEPLLALTRKETVFVWSGQCQSAFESLRRALTEYPILCFPNFQDSFVLTTDASNYAVGAVLSQIQSGQERVIGYASSSLTNAGRNWSTFDKEFWAVVWGVRHFRPYLCGRKFQIYTDHKPLLNIKSITHDSDSTGRRTRWSIELSSYDFEIMYKKGEENTNADCLSRIPVQEHVYSRECNVEVSASSAMENEGDMPIDMVSEQNKDPTLLMLKDHLIKKTQPVDLNRETPNVRCLWRQKEDLLIRDGILYRQVTDKNTFARYQLIVPVQLTRTILENLHSCPTGGHMGFEKTVDKIRQKYYWYGMLSQVKKWCKSCKDCAQSKSAPRKQRAPLVQDQATRPFERIAMDIVGPIPTTSDGNRFILVVSDYFTKWPEAFALKDHKALTVAQILVDEIICRYGIPSRLHCDQGRDFESRVIQEVCRLLDVKKTRTTPYHPESDGLVERLNRSLVQMLRTVGEKNQKDWDKQLPKILLAYRSSVHSTTKFTPHFLMFGREVQLPIDVMFGGVGERFQSATQYAQETKAHLDKAFEFVRTNTGAAQKQQKKQYDKKVYGTPLTEGDVVMVYSPAVKQGLSKKLHKHWDGPWTIKRKISDVVFQLRKEGTRKQMTVHFNRLRKFENYEENRRPEPPNQADAVNPPQQNGAAGLPDDAMDPPQLEPDMVLLEMPRAEDIEDENESDSEESDNSSTSDSGPIESSSGSDSHGGHDADTWGAGRTTTRPARFRDFVA